MKINLKTSLKIRLATLGLMLSATLLPAQVTNSYAFNLSPDDDIPDGNPSGLLEQFDVSDVIGTISKITISLDITGGYNGDLYAYLVGPLGQTAILLNRPGVVSDDPFGFADTGLSITLDDSGGNVNIHDYGFGSYGTNGSSQVTGTWGSDGRNIDPQSAPAAFEGNGTLEGADTGANLNSFLGGNANGTWNIFIADLVPGGGPAILNGIILNITTVDATPTPEPSALVFVVLGGVALICVQRRRAK